MSGDLNFRRKFQEFQRQASVRLHSIFHDLRNTALTNWFRNRMSEHDVMRLAGHASFETTHRFYLAVADDLVDRARAAADAGLGQKLRRICGEPTVCENFFWRYVNLLSIVTYKLF